MILPSWISGLPGVVNAEPVKKADRLLKLTLEVGDQTRQVGNPELPGTIP